MRDIWDKVLPPAGVPRALAVQSALYAVGNGAYLTGSVVFFSVYVGLTPMQIGIGLSVAGFVALFCSLPFGHLADRIGGQRAWVTGALVGAAAFLAYPLAGGFWAAMVVLTVEAMADVLANAGRQVYTAAAVPRESRVRTMAFARAYLNAGFTIGAGLGAAALALDSRLGLLVLVFASATGLLINAAVVSRMPAARVELGGPRPSPWGVLRDHPYTALATLLGVLWLHGVIWGDVLPLWAITMTDAPKPVLGGLFALNTVLAVLLQVPATRGADSLRGSARLLRWSALATAVACPVVALTARTHGWGTIALLGLAVVLTTATELWLSAAQWYLNTEVPPAEQRGAYAGASRSMFGVARMVGPAALTFVAIHSGGWGWWLIAAFFAACVFTVQPVLDWIARTPRNTPAPAAETAGR